jgi:hypothetical protein
MSQRSANLLAVAYLLVVLALDVRFRLGVGGLALALAGFVAIVVLLGVGPRLRTRLRRGVRAVQVFHQTEQYVEETKAILSQPDFQARISPAVRDAFWRIASRLDQTARIIRHDPNKHRFAESFRGSYALPIRDLCRHYVTLSSRGVESARAEIERTERQLPRIERQLDEVFEAIHRGDISGLRSVNEMLEFQDGDQL